LSRAVAAAVFSAREVQFSVTVSAGCAANVAQP